MAPYSTERVGNRHTNILVAATGEHVCQLRNNEVASWLHRAERARADEAAFVTHRTNARRAAVLDYLAVRAARKAEAARQGNLF